MWIKNGDRGNISVVIISSREEYILNKHLLHCGIGNVNNYVGILMLSSGV